MMKDTMNKLMNMTYGTELELERIDRETAARAVQSVVGGTISRERAYDAWVVTAPDGRKWKAVRDGSLGVRSAEVVTPILTMADMDTLQKVLRALRAAGARATERCGAHVHVGAADLTPQQLANLVKIFYRQERLIAQACGVLPSRMGYADYTEPRFLERVQNARVRTMEELNRMWFGRYTPHAEHYDTHRYRMLNLNNLWGTNPKKTVEFRLFNGTHHAGHLKANILLSLCLVNLAREAKAASAKRQRAFARETSKYDVRVFLLRLGMIGPEFKNARAYLLSNLGGSTAWKNGRPA